MRLATVVDNYTYTHHDMYDCIHAKNKKTEHLKILDFFK